jgi:DNA-binding beta-propeller fold protein YncE
MRSVLITAIAACCAAGCAGSGGVSARPAHRPHTHPAPRRTRPAHARTRSRAAPAPRPVAVVSAESEDAVLEVSLPGGRVVRRAVLAPDPTTVAAGRAGPVVAVSPQAGVVSLLAPRTLRRIRVVRGFRSPQIAAVAPGGRWALVTDAAAGTVSALDLRSGRIAGRVRVGPGAHHIAISPDGRRAWVALGETAATIVTLDCADMRRLRVTGRIHPPVSAHDLAFAPGGATVWVTSAARPFVSVLSARSGRLLARVPAGEPPQHIVFGGPGRPHVYIASGYGSSIERVDPADFRVVRTAAVPYGSFNLAVAGRALVVTSLLDGRVTELDAGTLRRRMSRVVAAEARSVAIGHW